MNKIFKWLYSKTKYILEDAIDIREIKNLTLANQVLKYKRIKKQQADQEAQMANIQAQTQILILKLQKKQLWQMFKKLQALNETNVQFERAKSDFEIQRMQTAAQIEARTNGSTV